MRRLKVISGPASGQAIEVEREVVIGREGADLTIPDPEISRRHAVVRPTERGVEIQDLGSSNGTVVDGRQIDAPVTLTRGGKVEVGSSEIEVELELHAPTRVAEAGPEAAPTSAPPPAASRGGRPSTPLIVLGALVGLAAIAVIAVLALGGDDSSGDDKKVVQRVFDADVTTVALDSALTTDVVGLVKGKPIERMSIDIRRRVTVPPRPGGPPVPFTATMTMSGTGGAIKATLTGTAQILRSGDLVDKAQATVSGGTGEFEGVTGSFTITGKSPPGPFGHQKARGTLRY